MKRLLMAVFTVFAVTIGTTVAFANTVEGKVLKTDMGAATVTVSAQDGTEKMIAVQSPDSLKSLKKGERIRISAFQDKSSGVLRANSIEILQ